MPKFTVILTGEHGQGHASAVDCHDGICAVPKHAHTGQSKSAPLQASGPLLWCSRSTGPGGRGPYLRE